MKTKTTKTTSKTHKAAMLKQAKRDLAKLDSLQDKEGPVLFQRARIAYRLISNKVWLAHQFGGSIEKAYKQLYEEKFHNVWKPGDPSVYAIVTCYKEYPSLKLWKERNFNLQDMWAEIVLKKSSTNSTTSTAAAAASTTKDRWSTTRRIHEQVCKDRDQALLDLDDAKRQIARLQAENATLKQQLEASRSEIARLKGRISELEKFRRKQNKRQLASV